MLRPICGGVVVILCVLLTHKTGIAQAADTVEVRKIMALATALREHNPDSSYALTQKGIELARVAHDQVGLVDLFISRGAYHWTKNNYLPAIDDYNEALSLSHRINFKKGVYRAQINLGQVHSKLGDYPRAIDYFLKGIALGDAAQFDNSSAYNSLAVAYKKNNNLEQAVLALQEAVKLIKPSPDTFQNGLRGGIYSNLGNIYLIKGELDTAMYYQKKALHIFDSLHQTRGQVVCYNNIAEILILQEKKEEALIWSQKSLDLSHQAGLYANEASALEGMATVAAKKGDRQHVLNLLSKAIRISEEHKHKTELIRLYRSIAGTYESLGKNELALLYLKKHIAAKDSVFNQEANNKVANLRVGYEINKREIDKKLLMQEHRIALLNRNILIGCVVALLVMAIIFTYYQFLRIKKNKLVIEQQRVIHETQQQLLYQELENEKLKQQELQWEIEKSSRELTTHALHLLQKNEMLEEIKEGLVDIHNELDPETRKDIQKLVSSINLSHHQDKEWLGFKAHFEKIHVGFFERLQQEYPDLSGNDIKICSLVKLNLGLKETASILGISTESVKTARYRLRKKLKLESSQNLVSFLAGI